MENVSPFRVDEAAISPTVFRCRQANTKPEGAGVIGRLSEIIFGHNSVAFVLPKLQVVVRILARELQEQAGREIGEAFRQPLVVVCSPSNQVSPPLMSNFVRRHLLDEVIEIECVALQQCIALRGIEKGDYREVHEHRTRLAKVEGRLLSDRQPFKRRGTEELS